MKNDFEYNLRTAIGFLIIVGGLAGGIYLAWWLSTGGDVIEILRRLKMGLPGWAWQMLKYGLSVAFGIMFVLIFVVMAFIVLGGGRRRMR